MSAAEDEECVFLDGLKAERSPWTALHHLLVAVGQEKLLSGPMGSLLY
jgi:hypothetical protein